MKLAVVSLMTGVPWGGSEELWAAAAREALARGIAVEAHLPAWPSVPAKVAELAKFGVRIAYWKRPDPSLAARIANRVWTSTNLVKQVQRSDADALLVSLGSAFDIAGYPKLCDALRASSRPFVLVVQHNTETPLPGWVKERVEGFYERAACVAFVSDRNRRSAERQLARPIPNAVVLQNPVNLVSLEAVQWPESSPHTPDEVGLMACVARLEVAAKGQDVLFEALAEPVWKTRDWRLALFGEGPDRDDLERLAKMYGIAERVTFAGQARDLREVWANQQLLVLPSRSEGTPLALVEAQIAGRPAVVTDVGDSASWVAEGFVAEAATAASFGRALERAWERRGDWKPMGARAHEATMRRVDRNPGATLLAKLLSACGLAVGP